jgi:preprotein translocase subunit YajC
MIWIPQSPREFLVVGAVGWIFYLTFFYVTVIRPQRRYWKALEKLDRERYEQERNQP